MNDLKKNLSIYIYIIKAFNENGQLSHEKGTVGS